jgi:hypothetical protein
MPRKDDETTYFRYVRTLDGRLESVDVGRRNGRLVPRIPREITEHGFNRAGNPDLRELLREVMYGLNRKERRTWLLLLLGNSILDIATRERVSRTAIYERIRGNSQGHGGMIRKNDYVAIWWRNQPKRNRHE